MQQSRLKAFVVPDIGADATVLRKALEDVALARLEVEQRPRSFTFGLSLPRNEMGKLSDWG